MNMHKPIVETTESEMSTDGYVTIPEAIRRAKGLVPGAPVVVGLNDRGEVVIATRIQAKRMGESVDQRRLRIRKALDDLAGRYSTGQSTSDVMEELRGHPAR